MKIRTQFVPAAVLLFTSALVRAQGINFAKTEILTQRLAPDFYTLTGSPGVDPGHPEGAGGPDHTGGNPNFAKQGALVIARDTIVRLEKSDVIMIGDFYRHYGYPFVDSAHGGSFAGVIQAVDQVMALAGPGTKFVPGHGTVIGRADLPPYRDMIVSVRKTVAMVGVAGRFSRPPRRLASPTLC